MNTIAIGYDWKYEYYTDPVTRERHQVCVAKSIKRFVDKEGVKEFLSQHDDATVVFDTSRSGVIWTSEYL